MKKVLLRAGKSTKEVICTSNHRWILKNGQVTTDLKEGDRLYCLQELNIDHTITNREQAEAFAIGFIIGDGNDNFTQNRTYIRLCGEKEKYIDIFEKVGFKKSSYNKATILTRKGVLKQNFLSSKSWQFMTKEQKQFLFDGYFAADGAKDRNFIATSDSRIAEMIEEISALSGYYVSSKKEYFHDTNFKEDAYICEFRFRKHQPENICWTVESIKNFHAPTEYDAWCVEEPVTNTFTLANGIVTGNCCLVNLEDMLQNGTVISGTMIEKPHSFYTACNIATQIIAQVASCQSRTVRLA